MSVRTDCHVTQEVPKKRPSAMKSPSKPKKVKPEPAAAESDAEQAPEEELEASTEGSCTECDAFCFWCCCSVLPKAMSFKFQMKFMQVPPKQTKKAEAVTETLSVLVLSFVKSRELMEAGAKAKAAAAKAKTKAKAKAKGKANTLENDKFRMSNCHSLALMFEVFFAGVHACCQDFRRLPR